MKAILGTKRYGPIGWLIPDGEGRILLQPAAVPQKWANPESWPGYAVKALRSVAEESFPKNEADLRTMMLSANSHRLREDTDPLPANLPKPELFR